MSEIDYTEIAAKVAVLAVESMATGLSGKLSSSFDQIRVALHADLGRYLASTLSKVGFVKTILSSDSSILVERLYVPLEFKSKEATFSDIQVEEYLKMHLHVLITGMAGGGKSMFVRHLVASLVSRYRQVLPVHFELRALNTKDSDSIIDAIFAELVASAPQFSRPIFDHQLRAGKFALILDGFDEVNYDIRDRFANEINGFTSQFPRCPVLVTSRPEEGISSLHQFRVFSAVPMRKEQCERLIDNIEYDVEKKEQFKERVSADLFDKYPEFLSNPLLTTMMLMTFSVASEFPEKVTTFYQQAFEVLFQRHDRSKGVFTRKSYTELPIDVFSRVFSHFCAATYSEERFLFGEAEIYEDLRNAIQFEGEICDPRAFLNDLLQSTCLMQRDGLFTTFIHRSFQEYFASLFISKRSDPQMKMAIDYISRRGGLDSVARMVWHLEPDAFERSWAKIWVSVLLRRLNEVDPESDPIGVMKEYYSKGYFSLGSEEGGFLTEEITQFGVIANTLKKVYESEYLKLALVPEVQDERERVLKAIDQDREIRRQLEKLFTASQLERFRAEEGEPPGRVVALSELSNELVRLVRWDTWALRELQFFKNLNRDLNARLAERDRSFQSIFGTASPRPN
jgi:hypothetical protein